METVKEIPNESPKNASQRMHLDVVNKGRRHQLKFAEKSVREQLAGPAILRGSLKLDNSNRHDLYKPFR